MLDRLTIIAPASAGGGFDRTAQAVARALHAAGLVRKVTVRYSPGAGGLIGLAQFEDQVAAEPTVLIGGLTILGAEAENHATVSLSDLTPLCELYEAPLALAVRDDSPIRSSADLVEILRSDPTRIVWMGGSPGSANEILLWAIAARLGVPREQIKYIAVTGGGQQVIRQLVKNSHAVAIRNFDEFAAYASQPRIRVISVSTDKRFPGVSAPSLREAGLDLSMVDWKGVFLSPRATVTQREAIARVFATMLRSKQWRQELTTHNWQAAPDAFAGFPKRIAADRRSVTALAQTMSPDRTSIARLRDLLARPWRYALLALFAAVLALLAVGWQRFAAKRRERHLLATLDAVQARIGQDGVAREDRDTITRQLQQWNLSAAEVEIAWMILKGLQFKEIAAARETSERTVRQQAQAIYAKSGLTSRAALSAHFLEDLRF